MDIKELTERYQDRFDAHYLQDDNGMTVDCRAQNYLMQIQLLSLIACSSISMN